MTSDIMKSRSPLISKSILFLLALITSYSLMQSLCMAYDARVPEGMPLLYTVVFSLILAWWVRNDANARGFRLPYEFGTFVFFVWPAAIPYYGYRSRGWKELGFGVGTCALYLVPYIAGGVVLFVKLMRRA
jgi:hypothetical protein